MLTKLKDRPWTDWLKCPYIEYVADNKPHWGEEPFAFLKKSGIVINEKRFDDGMTRAEVFALLAQIVSKIDG